MRKVGAIGFAAFYLLLSTGMFVCILHCSGTYLFKEKLTSSIDREQTHRHSEAHCNKEKDCDCCDEHGEYVVKENIPTTKPTIDGFVPFCLVAYQYRFQFKLSVVKAESHTSRQNTGPPVLKKQPVYIINQTFLI